MDPDPGGPKRRGSGGSGSATLVAIIKLFLFQKSRAMEQQTGTTGILDLPPELLQQIILYCDHNEILHLKDVCLRFHSVCSSPSVWRNVRFNMPTPLNVLESCLPLMKNATTDLFVRGFLRKNIVRRIDRGSLSRAFLEELATSCPGLKGLCHQLNIFFNRPIQLNHSVSLPYMR
jgi:hypothetical protein